MRPTFSERGVALQEAQKWPNKKITDTAYKSPGVLAAVWDNYKDYTYLGTLEGSYQDTLIATDPRLRPLQAPFLGHMLGTKPEKI